MGEAVAELWWVPIVILACIGLTLAAKPFYLITRRDRLAIARRAFHWQRERLEAKLFMLAQERSGVNTPYWLSCDFDDDVTYVRNRSTGELSAFVSVSVVTEEVSSVCPEGQKRHAELSRNATAVFRYNGHHWDTDGLVIFNLTPSETVRFYRRDLIMVEQEGA